MTLLAVTVYVRHLLRQLRPLLGRPASQHTPSSPPPNFSTSPHPFVPSSRHPLIPSSGHPFIPSSLHPLTLFLVLLLALPARALDRRWGTIDTGDGLPSNIVLSTFCDRSGNLWFGTDEGVSLFEARHQIGPTPRGKWLRTFTTKDGLVDDRVYSIYQDRAGNLWFGTDGGVSRYDGKQFRSFTTKDGLVDDRVRSIIQDRAGNLWFATDGGVSRYDGRQFRSFTRRDGLADGRVLTIYQDRVGNLWFGTDSGVSRYEERKPTPTLSHLVLASVWNFELPYGIGGRRVGFSGPGAEIEGMRAASQSPVIERQRSVPGGRRPLEGLVESMTPRRSSRL